MAFYSRMHYERVGGFKAEDGLGPKRLRDREILEQAYAETQAKFGDLAPGQNPITRFEWMEHRIMELRNGE